jgi:hypothetical protein
VDGGKTGMKEKTKGKENACVRFGKSKVFSGGKAEWNEKGRHPNKMKHTITRTVFEIRTTTTTKNT